MLTQPLTLIGSPLSPFVRKALVALHQKRLPFLLDPLVPFFCPKDFLELSPTGTVPVLVVPEPRVAIWDSTVILEYIQESTPASDETSLFAR